MTDPKINAPGAAGDLPELPTPAYIGCRVTPAATAARSERVAVTRPRARIAD
jgi:hypothetical protein